MSTTLEATCSGVSAPGARWPTLTRSRFLSAACPGNEMPGRSGILTGHRTSSAFRCRYFLRSPQARSGSLASTNL